MASTRTHTTLFDKETVDRLMGAAHHELNGDFERRREHMGKGDLLAIEARLFMLRAVWTLLLDRSQS